MHLHDHKLCSAHELCTRAEPCDWSAGAQGVTKMLGSVSAMLFGRNVPNFMDVSAKQYGRFGQQIWTFQQKKLLFLYRC